jgi:hypothetical protein
VADLGPPGTEKGSTVTGVSVEGAPVCQATNLSRETKTLFNRWVELDKKLTDETITEEEWNEGLMLAQLEICANLRGGIEGTVVQLDGRDYLVDYCVPGHPCVRVIQKSETFIRDK